MTPDRKILVATRGDYMTRITLDPLLRSHPPECLHVVVVTSDSHGRSGGAFLKALWRDYERHYFFYELFQFFAFKIAGRLFRKTPFTVPALAHSLGIPVTFTEKINAPEIIELATTWQPDVLVSVKCTQRIRPALLALPRFGAINVHGSLLPKYAGRAPHFWTMVHGEETCGSTVHLMTDTFDDGGVLAQKTLPIAPGASAFSILREVARLGGEAMMEALPRLLDSAAAAPQDAAERTYFSSPTKDAYTRFRANGFHLATFAEVMAAIRDENRKAREK